MLSPLTSQIYEFEDFRLVPAEGLLLRNGTPVDLNPKAFAVLAMLVEHNGHLVSKAEILNTIWEGAFIEEGAIAKAVWFARNALGDVSKEKFIKTVPRRGYRFVATVSIVGGSGAFRLAELPGGENNAGEFVSEVQELISPISGGGATIGSVRNQEPDLSDRAIQTAAVSHIFERSKLPRLAIGMLLLVTAGALFAYLLNSRGPFRAAGPGGLPIRSIAVTSLKNLSGDDQDYFVHGITSTLNNALAGIPGLYVAPRPLENRRALPDSLSDVARELSVDGVLTGSINLNGDAVAVTINLWSLHSQRIEWSKGFEGKRNDIGGLQHRIAAELSNALGIRSAVDPSKVRAPSPKAPPEAENSFFKGEYYFDTATNSAKMSEKSELFSKAISEFEKAISIDPRFAEAHASLARTYHWLGSHGRADAYIKSKSAAFAAIQLDPNNAKAHASLAWVYWRHEWDWARAEAEYKQALAISGDAPGPLSHGYALFISAQGRHDEAIEIIRRNEESSPLSLAAKLSSAFIKLRARKYNAAELDFRRVLELDPQQTPALSGLALTLASSDRFDEAIATARRANSSDDNPAQRLTLAWVFAKSGRVKDANEILKKAEQQFHQDLSNSDPYAIAKVYAGLSDNGQAFAWLERAFTVRSQYLVFMGVSPEFDSISGDPKFAEMLNRLGLPRR